MQINTRASWVQVQGPQTNEGMGGKGRQLSMDKTSGQAGPSLLGIRQGTGYNRARFLGEAEATSDRERSQAQCMAGTYWWRDSPSAARSQTGLATILCICQAPLQLD